MLFLTAMAPRDQRLELGFSCIGDAGLVQAPMLCGAVAELGYRPRIDSIGLGQIAHAVCELAHLARINHRHPQAGAVQLGRQRSLQAAAGLHHHPVRLELLKLRDQALDTGTVIGQCQRRAIRLTSHHQLRLTDFDSYHATFFHCLSPARQVPGLA